MTKAAPEAEAQTSGKRDQDYAARRLAETRPAPATTHAPDIPGAREQKAQAQARLRAHSTATATRHGERDRLSAVIAGQTEGSEVTEAMVHRNALDQILRQDISTTVKLEWEVEQATKKLDGLLARRRVLLNEQDRLSERLAVGGTRDKEIREHEAAITRYRYAIGQDELELARIGKSLENLGE